MTVFFGNCKLIFRETSRKLKTIQWWIVVIQSTDTVAKYNTYLINFKKLNMTNSQHGEFEIYFTYCFAQNATSILRI